MSNILLILTMAAAIAFTATAADNAQDSAAQIFKSKELQLEGAT